MPDYHLLAPGRPASLEFRPIAVVSAAVPPSPSGQARVLQHLLGSNLREQATLLSDQIGLPGKSESPHPIGHYVRLAPPQFLLTSGWFSHRPRMHAIDNYLGLNSTIWRRAREIVAALRPNAPAALVGCSGNPFDLPASFLAARRLGIPLLAYLFDDPVFQWPPGIYRKLARHWERLWARRAHAVIASNEYLVEDMLRREPKARMAMVRNPVADIAFALEEMRWPASTERPFNIVYTGSVYHAQGDAFGNLVQALDRFGGQAKLHLYTSQPGSVVTEHGLAGQNVILHDYIEGPAIHKIQQTADVVFLPLAFRSTIPEVIRTSAPAKMAEYIACGRPVLVHAPHDSFISNFFRRNNCGVVVDRPEPADLVGALRSIAEDPGLRARLRAATSAVSAEFRVERARSIFWSLVRRAEGGPEH